MSLNKEQLEKYMAEAGNPSIEVAEPKLILYPYRETVGRDCFLTSALVFSCKDDNGGHHNMLLSFRRDEKGEEQYAFWCSDKYLEGRVRDDQEVEERLKMALESIPGKKYPLLEQLRKMKGAFEASASCAFWAEWRRNQKPCEHVNAMLARIRDTLPNYVPNYLDMLADAYDEVMSGGGDSSNKGLNLAAFAFKVPVLIEGDRGAGKTYAARAFIRSNDYRGVECGGHEGLEAPDLLGYLVPLDKTQVVWKDGPLTEAFRSASKGEKTVLIIDEMLRIRQRELSILLTALSPDNGVYRLRTGRVLRVEDGVAIEEVLECKVEDLFVVATTNVGSEYAVDDIDPALAERFVVLRMDTSSGQLRNVIEQKCREKGFDNPRKIAERMVKFFDAMTELVNRGQMAHAPTTRTLTRAVDLADSEADISRMLEAQMLLWVARTVDGRPEEAQLNTAKECINKCF